MSNLKTAETVGFIMIIVAFILWICNDLGYFLSFEKATVYIGLIGTIVWSMAYAQREKEENN